MKKTVIATCVGMLFAFHSSSQSWITQTSGTTNDLWSVSFTDAIHGWVSGSQGTILSTSDAGTTWTAQTSGVTTPILRNIFLFDLNNGWAVGDNGTILHTSNGGTTWTPQTSGVSGTLRQVSFATLTEGWICGAAGTILHTTDGGTTWTAQTSGTTIGLMRIHFTDALNGWSVGSSGATQNGIILHTSDGGATWAAQTAPNTSNLNACTFTDALNGWVGGNAGDIFNTTDGGTTWTAQTNPSTNIVRGMHFVNATDGWATGDAGSIVNTTDGGTTWATQTSGTNQILRDIQFVNPGRGYAVGVAGTLLFFNQPAITFTGAPTPFSTVVGTPSAAQSLSVSGMNLTANLDVTAPTDFEVSLTSGSGYGSAVSIPAVNSVVAATTVYVHYNPATAGVHSGNATAATTGATTLNIALNGASGNAGLSELDNSTIRVFPNPANGSVTIQTGSSLLHQATIVDLAGKTLQQVADLTTNTCTLSLTGIPAGAYLLVLHTNNGRQTQRLLVN